MTTEEHWTSDEELVERFVMLRITGTEREGFERHLNACPYCRERIRQEMAIVGGVRKFGREEMKRRLAGKLTLSQNRELVAARIATPASAPFSSPEPQQKSSRRWNWIPSVALAACVVIIAGIGVINHWWWATPLEEGSKPETIARVEEPVANDRKKEEFPRVETLPSQQGRNEQNAPLADGSGELGKDKESRPAHAQESVVAAVPMHSSAGGRPLEKHDLAAAKQDLHGNVEIGSEWVEGTISTNASDDLDMNEEAETKAALKMKKSASPLQRAGVPVDARIMQRPITDAPAGQQKRQQSTQTVLAHISQSGTRLLVTLYPAVALRGQDIQQAKAYQLAPDSISIVVPGKNIRFKLTQAIGVQAK